MKIKRIIVATNNNHKVEEIRQILDDINIPIFSLKDLEIESSPEENGETFRDNALIKARDIPLGKGDIVLADDSGLEIDYLGGRPGVYTSRYMGENSTHEVKMRGILKEMEDAKKDERSARFKSAVALVDCEGNEFVATGVMEGSIAKQIIKGAGGFGYDPIFIIEKYGKSAAEVGTKKKNEVSHRSQALKIIKKYIEENYERF